MPEDLTADQLLPTNPVVRDATVNLRKRDLDANEVQSFLDKAISGRGAGPGPGLPPPRAGWAGGQSPPFALMLSGWRAWRTSTTCSRVMWRSTSSVSIGCI